MNPMMKRLTRKRLVRSSLGALLAVAVLVAGCDVMDVSNPNSLVEEDIQSPSSAAGLKNGVLNATMVATGWTYAPLSTISDELYWNGSYESFGIYNVGRVTVENNEITVNTFPELSEARWLADNGITQLEAFDQDGALTDPTILTKVYIYSALVRITIADAFDNFVYSDRQEAAPPIGEDNMAQVYDEAIAHLDAAASRAQSNGNTTLEMQALGLRARAKHAQGVWQKLNPPGSMPADPLVNGTGATADAEAALALMEGDYKAQFDYASAQVNNYLAGQVNQRQEVLIAEPFNDLKTGNPDPRMTAIRADFLNTDRYTENFSPFTWLSAREMHLIIAEEAVGTDDDRARTELNAVRALDGLPPVEPSDDLTAFIEHERRANLFLQGRRLNDMYRFGSQSPDWLPNEDAATRPGTLLPIPDNEILANPNL
jgi:hypothetical protein